MRYDVGATALAFALLNIVGAIVNPPSSPIHRASYLGQPDVVAEELARGAPIDAPSVYGWTPLHWAAIGDRPEVAQLLLEHGANPDARADYDLTPLHWASLRGHDRVIAVLASRGANLQAKNLYGMTALHLAGTEAVVAALAEAGAKLDVRDDAGLTPLFTARTKEAGQALLRRGADVNVHARDGRMLLDMLVVNTMEPRGLILYGRRSAGRLRGEFAEIPLQILNVGPVDVAQIGLHVETEAATALDPPRLEKLHPGQLATLSFGLNRRPGIAERVFPLVAQVSSRGVALGVFEMDVDTTRSETNTDRGMSRLSHAQLRATPSRHYQLALLAAPILVLAGWLFARRRSSR